MMTAAHDDLPTPARRALDALATDAGDPAALDTLASSDVLVPVPDDIPDTDSADPTTLAVPVLERPGGEPVVPVFTSEETLSELLPAVDRYRLVPLGALAAQWPDDALGLAVDAGSAHGLILTSEGIHTLATR
ncbi:SseB family protein [Streptomyces sp. NPDC001982]|uniref:SseB family protein n=1 Tax=unclassified Streptomyces TaxID=2593676 RepID=UPI003321958F